MMNANTIGMNNNLNILDTMLNSIIILKEHAITLKEHDEQLKNHDEQLKDYNEQLNNYNSQLEEHNNQLNDCNMMITAHTNAIGQMDSQIFNLQKWAETIDLYPLISKKQKVLKIVHDSMTEEAFEKYANKPESFKWGLKSGLENTYNRVRKMTLNKIKSTAEYGIDMRDKNFCTKFVELYYQC